LSTQFIAQNVVNEYMTPSVLS